MLNRQTLDTWHLLGAAMTVGTLQQVWLGLACRLFVSLLVWALCAFT